MLWKAWFVWLPLLLASLPAFSSAQGCAAGLSPFAPEYSWAPYSLKQFKGTKLYETVGRSASRSVVARVVRQGQSAEYRRLVLAGRESIEPALMDWSGQLSSRFSGESGYPEGLAKLYEEYWEASMGRGLGAVWRRQPRLAGLCAASIVGCAASAVLTIAGLLPTTNGVVVTAALGAVYGGSFWVFFRRDLARAIRSLPAPTESELVPNPFNDLYLSLLGFDGRGLPDLGVVIELPRENIVAMLINSPKPQLELVSIRW